MRQHGRLKQDSPIVDISMSKKDLLKCARVFSEAAFEQALEHYHDTEDPELKSIIGFLGVSLSYLSCAGVANEMICDHCINETCERWWRECGECACEVTH